MIFDQSVDQEGEPCGEPRGACCACHVHQPHGVHRHGDHLCHHHHHHRQPTTNSTLSPLQSASEQGTRGTNSFSIVFIHLPKIKKRNVSPITKINPSGILLKATNCRQTNVKGCSLSKVGATPGLIFQYFKDLIFNDLSIFSTSKI